MDEYKTLENTVGPMISRNYTKRFKAEYYQTKIRYNKLYNIIDKLYNDDLGYTMVTPIEILILQLKAMDTYLRVLEKRAEIELIDLNKDRYHISDEV